MAALIEADRLVVRSDSASHVNVICEARPCTCCGRLRLIVLRFVEVHGAPGVWWPVTGGPAVHPDGTPVAPPVPPEDYSVLLDAMDSDDARCRPRRCGKYADRKVKGRAWPERDYSRGEAARRRRQGPYRRRSHEDRVSDGLVSWLAS